MENHGRKVPAFQWSGQQFLVQQVTQAHPQIGMDAGECNNAQLVEEKVTTRETAEPNGTMNFGAPGAIETITATTLAD